MIRAFNCDMSDLPCKAEDLIGKVDFVLSDPPYKITRARYDMEFDYRTIWEVIQRMLAPVRGGGRHLLPHGGGRDPWRRP